MRFLISVCFLLVMIFANINHALAGDLHQYGNVIYQVPTGYYEQQSGSTRFLFPQGQSLNNNEIAFAIMPSIGEIPGNLKQFLSQVVEQAEAGREVVQRQFERSTADDGTKVVLELSVTKVDGVVNVSIYLLANSGGRGELVAISSNNLNAVQKYDQQIKEFFGGISFANRSNQNSVANFGQNGSQGGRANNGAATKQRTYNNQLNQRTYSNQIFLNSITNNYNNLSRSIY